MIAIERMKRAQAVFEAVARSEFGGLCSLQRFNITNNYIVERLGNRQRFSEAFLTTMFPFAEASRDVYHYTSVETLASIAGSKIWRLYSMKKNIDQAELRTFAEHHGFEGYTKPAGQPYYKVLADDLFLGSFALSSADNAYLWSVFAELGAGVRLTLRLTPKSAELRMIRYAGATHTLLRRLNDALKADGLPTFVPWSVSKIGAFYLPGCLQQEDEVRLLIKRHEGGRNDAESDGAYEYWPLPLGVNDVCDVEITEIRLGSNAHRARVERAVSGSVLASVPII